MIAQGAPSPCEVRVGGGRPAPRDPRALNKKNLDMHPLASQAHVEVRRKES